MVMRESLDGYQGGLLIGGRRISILRYADDIVLIATSEQELQVVVVVVVVVVVEYLYSIYKYWLTALTQSAIDVI